MNCEIVDRNKYKGVIDEPFTVFHSLDFNYLNHKKCNDLLYFLFSDSKYRGGIILGEMEGELYSPFSAPYGGFTFLKEMSPKNIYKVIDSLITKCKTRNYKRIEITLPPIIYSVDHISKLIHALYYSGFQLLVMDINNHIELTEKDNVKDFFNRNARRNFSSSNSSEFNFKKVDSLEGKEKAYLVIKKNREANEYPLKMDFEDILSTTEVLDADFFICEYEDKEVAAALVYHVNKDINQVIYWGHDLKYEDKNPMYFFVYKILDFYKKEGLRILDIGPSSENGIVDDGLFYFKRSIGCESSMKLKMENRINEK